MSRMRRTGFVGTLIVVLYVFIPMQAKAATHFEEEFDDPSLSQWETELLISGKRWCEIDGGAPYEGPGVWVDVSTDGCFGDTTEVPYGSVEVATGTARFRSTDQRGFPYLWLGGYELPSPFPLNGDFVFEARVKFDSTGGFGAGIKLRDWPDSSPVGDNPPNPNVLRIWTDVTHYVGLLGQRLNVPSTADFHDYRLEYTDGYYSLYFDGELLLGPVASDLRPNAVLIGNPVYPHNSSSVWTSFTIDYIRVLADASADECDHAALPQNSKFFLAESVSCSDRRAAYAFLENVVPSFNNAVELVSYSLKNRVLDRKFKKALADSGAEEVILLLEWADLLGTPNEQIDALDALGVASDIAGITLNDEDFEVYLEAIETAIAFGKTLSGNPKAGIKNIFKNTISTGVRIVTYFQVIEALDRMGELEVARDVLSRYYAYGSDFSALSAALKIDGEATLEDIVRAVALDLDVDLETLTNPTGVATVIGYINDSLLRVQILIEDF